MRLLAISLVVLAFGAAAIPGWAEDGDQRRYYLHLRWQDTNPVTEVHDHMGFSLGANLGRHWGLELSTDYFERLLWRSGETIAALKRAYRLFFNSDLNLSQALERARSDLPPLPEVERFLDFVESSERGVPA